MLTPNRSTGNSVIPNVWLISLTCQSGALFRFCLLGLDYDGDMRHITTLLFDLGGVLIELGDLSDMMATSTKEPWMIWQEWIRIPAVRSFESGLCDEAQFARNMIDEFELSLTGDEFLEKFRRWPKRTFPEAEPLLEELSKEYRLASLSNTNLTHYDHFLSKQPIISSFEATFFSHETGLIKPEPEAFLNVLSHLALEPDQIMFFDDNQTNVNAAKAIGMVAERVNAPSDVIVQLNRAGLLAGQH